MSAARPTAEPLWDLVEESLDESVFLWKRWEGELRSLTRNPAEIWTWTEDRLQGALDGVRAAGSHLPGQLASGLGLASDDPMRWTVSAHLLAARSPAEARKILGDAVREADEARLWHLVRGIECADLDGSFAPIAAMLATQSPLHSAALCRLKAFRRANPGREVSLAFESGNPACRVEALRAARFSSDPAHRRLIVSTLRDDDVTVRRAAIDAGLALGLPEAWAAAIDLARLLQPSSAELLPTIAMLGGPAEHDIVRAALRRPELRRHAIYALGFIGTADAVETCIAGMRDPALARLAGEAYCAITGADLDRDSLAAPEPEGPAQPIPLEEDDLDADLVPKAEDLWPLPDLEAVRKHWERLKPGLPGGRRFLHGRQVSMATLVDFAENGPMLRRADVLRELAARTSGRYDVEARAFVRVQRRMMAAGRVALAGANR
jgi:uncharacterized protein (TIGR02270 family)